MASSKTNAKKINMRNIPIVGFSFGTLKGAECLVGNGWIEGEGASDISGRFRFDLIENSEDQELDKPRNAVNSDMISGR